jgi:hypothetical protein
LNSFIKNNFLNLTIALCAVVFLTVVFSFERHVVIDGDAKDYYSYLVSLFIDHNFAEIERMFNYLELKIDDDKIQDFIISDKRKVRINPN